MKRLSEADKQLYYKKETIKRLRTAKHYVVITEQDDDTWSFHNSKTPTIKLIGYLNYVLHHFTNEIAKVVVDSKKRTTIKGKHHAS